jgi:hypothetical protein
MLALYRRHRHYCKGDNPHNSRTFEYVSGTLQSTFKRHHRTMGMERRQINSCQLRKVALNRKSDPGLLSKNDPGTLLPSHLPGWLSKLAPPRDTAVFRYRIELL